MQRRSPEELLSGRLAEVAQPKSPRLRRKVSLQIVAKPKPPRVTIRSSTGEQSRAPGQTTQQAWASSTRAQRLLPKNNLKQFINTRNLKWIQRSRNPHPQTRHNNRKKRGAKQAISNWCKTLLIIISLLIILGQQVLNPTPKQLPVEAKSPWKLLYRNVSRHFCTSTRTFE